MHFKMKEKIAITIDEETLEKINEALKSKVFRNRSHFFEVAAFEMMKKQEEIENGSNIY
jgi:metal-responsive CopG/Arc/MetJ family transcriptional regulator